MVQKGLNRSKGTHREIDPFQKIGGRLNAFLGKTELGGRLIETVHDGQRAGVQLRTVGFSQIELVFVYNEREGKDLCQNVSPTFIRFKIVR